MSPQPRGFLLDTNVPSELTRPLPDPQVKSWVESQDNDLFHLSVITVGELRKGVSLLPKSKRKVQLEEWLETYLLPLFDTRLLSVTRSIADRWGSLSADRQLRGMPLSMADGLIAATALEYDLIPVTRNYRDFSALGLNLLNPWETQP